ncbi:hypothetical protein ERO13_D12G093233v2 [Gossypium hirsutum]|nr:hypothetical protein ERO13_D12G093233v2 [Gossypium hirsutum]
MLYPITMKTLNQVFSPHGFVEKIVTFQKLAGFEALIQYQGRQNAILPRISLQEQKGEPSQHLGYGDAGVGFPQMANATAIANLKMVMGMVAWRLKSLIIVILRRLIKH